MTLLGSRRVATLGAVLAGAFTISTFATSQAAPPDADPRQGPLHVKSLVPHKPIFGPSSEWARDVSEAPVAGQSGRLVDLLSDQVTSRYNGVAAFNDYQYGVGFYSVPDDQPTVDLAFDDCQNKGYEPGPMVDAEQGGVLLDVPMPDEAEVPEGTDRSVALYQRSTDTLWEFWKVSRTADGGWQACWGGRMEDAGESPGYFTDYLGVAASGMSLTGGAIGLREVALGEIDHAISLSVPEAANWDIFSYPAQRSDGFVPAGQLAIAEGQRFRLDASVDVDALGLHPVAATIARAAKKHGFIVTDLAGAVAVTAERGSTNPSARFTWDELRDGTPTYSIMQDFPWDRLEALPFDYGKP